MNKREGGLWGINLEVGETTAAVAWVGAAPASRVPCRTRKAWLGKRTENKQIAANRKDVMLPTDELYYRTNELS